VYKAMWRGTEVAVKRFLEQNLSPQLVQVSRGALQLGCSCSCYCCTAMPPLTAC
jgi:hypothetical protein